ncbi:hypothetical protein SCO02_00620 [Staphylococcus ureilyticus]|uniref:Uncharacterized protein n=1 Tax=Staphylococcus ureilyticus TaxID=94138 RepID=A0AB34AE89_STAUR|nr:hypothetical protein [Staphylococcus ureilyticus]GEQ01621.1 hypothetical protein SCO02_00620 [Staphylococcus ureilyticus]
MPPDTIPNDNKASAVIKKGHIKVGLLPYFSTKYNAGKIPIK